MESTSNNNQNTGVPTQSADSPVAPGSSTAGKADAKRTEKASRQQSNKRGGGKLALIIALVALGLSGWQWYQGQQQGALQEGNVSQLEGRLNELIEAQQQSQNNIRLRMEGLPSADQWQQSQLLTAELQRSQQVLGQRLSNLQGDARADWKLAEAEYLLRLASLRLVAVQDVVSARELLEAVDEILQSQPDSGVFAVREQLARYQTQLEALPVIDRSGIYLKLAAMHEQVAGLVALPVPVFDPNEVTPEEEFEDRLARRTRGERMLMRLERYVRVDFQRGKVINPLLDEAELQRVRRTLQLTLEQAQWAVLRGEGEVYSDSMARAGEMLEQFFEMDNPQVQAMRNRLNQLAEQPVTLTPPDLAPLQQGLAAYIQSRGVRSSVDSDNAGDSAGASTEESGDE